MASTIVEQALDEVYSSFREIIKKKQRHLYCNMLDLLSSSCKATGSIISKLETDETIHFWLVDILELMFDDDISIQNSAIAAMEQALCFLDPKTIHTSKIWAQVKSTIANIYPPKLHKLQERSDPNWHRILSLFLQIYDTELTSNSNITNIYLKVIEEAMRSTENAVKNQALICWRTFIRIFSTEPIMPKRLKLLVLPLRTATPMDEHSTRLKFEVWWFLLTRVNKQIGHQYETVMKPFIGYVSGIGSYAKKCNILNNFPALRKSVIPCVAVLLSFGHDEGLDNILMEERLEVFPQPSQLMVSSIFKAHWDSLFHMAKVSYHYLLMSELTGTATCDEKHLLQSILSNLTLAMMRYNTARYTEKFCSEIKRLLPEHSLPLRIVVEVMSASGEYFQRDLSSDTDYHASLTNVLELCIKLRRIAPVQALRHCIHNILFEATESVEKQAEFDFLIKLYGLLTNANKCDDDYSEFEVKMIIWENLSIATNAYLLNNCLTYRIKSNAESINSWILWPLKTCGSFIGVKGSQKFVPDICDIWAQLLSAGHNEPNRISFLINVKSALLDLWKQRKEEEPSIKLLVDAYVSAAQKEGKMLKDIYGLFKEILQLPHLQPETLEACLTRLHVLITNLTNEEITAYFDELKAVLTVVVKCCQNQKKSISFFEEWKRKISIHLRTHPTKSFANQIRDLFKGKEEFIPIPTVWSLRPEKLTEHQKERLAEKATIPALYNDLSRSEDTSLKPWTPKKLVLTKNDKNEIAMSAENTPRADEIVKDGHQDIIILTPYISKIKTAESTTVATATLSPSSKRSRSLTPNRMDSDNQTKNDEKPVAKRSRKSGPRKLSLEIENVEARRLTRSKGTEKRHTRSTGHAKLHDVSKLDDISKSARRKTTGHKEDKDCVLTENLIKKKVASLEKTSSKRSVNKSKFNASKKLDKSVCEQSTTTESKGDQEMSEFPQVESPLAPESPSKDITVTPSSPKIGSTSPLSPSHRSSPKLEPSEKRSSLTASKILNKSKCEKSAATQSKGDQEMPNEMLEQHETELPQEEYPLAPATPPKDMMEMPPSPPFCSNLPVSPSRRSSLRLVPSEKNSGLIAVKKLNKSVCDQSATTQSKDDQEMHSTQQTLEQQETELPQEESPLAFASPPKDQTETPPSPPYSSNLPVSSSRRSSPRLMPSEKRTTLIAFSPHTQSPRKSVVLPNTSVGSAATRESPLKKPSTSSMPPANIKCVDISSAEEFLSSPGSSEEILANYLINAQSIEIEEIPFSQPETRLSPEGDIETTCRETSIANTNNTDATMDIQNSAAAQSAPIPELVAEPPQESSPKKQTIKPCNPLSPVGRKRISNNVSPTVRPKHTPQMTGRGAQLINLVRRSNLFASTPSSQKSPSLHTKILEHTSTPIQPNPDLLVFSKTLPSLDASPSVSILKRKAGVECTPDDAAKRSKRVSFHDPPVSVTKEYIRDATPTNSLRRHDRFCSPSEAKRTLLLQKPQRTNDPANPNIQTDKTSADNDVYIDNAPSPPVIDVNYALRLVVEQCPIETVLDKYFASADQAKSLTAVNVLTKFLSKQMDANEKVKKTTLEMLSESHSKDFLDHAVRENLSSVVCDRLDLQSVLDYIFAKSKINSACRMALLTEIPNVVRSSKLENERFELIEALLQCQPLNDDEILNIIGLVTALRNKNAATNNLDNLAESATDSSSNL